MSRYGCADTDRINENRRVLKGGSELVFYKGIPGIPPQSAARLVEQLPIPLCNAEGEIENIVNGLARQT